MINRKYIYMVMLCFVFCVQTVLAVDGTVTNIDISDTLNSTFMIIGTGFVIVAVIIVLKILASR